MKWILRLVTKCRNIKVKLGTKNTFKVYLNNAE